MTEPTRDALHAETLAKADEYARSLIAGFEDSDVQEAVESVAVSRAYLALRAEVERLRAKAAIVDAMERELKLVEAIRARRVSVFQRHASMGMPHPTGTKGASIVIETEMENFEAGTLDEALALWVAAYAAATREGD